MEQMAAMPQMMPARMAAPPPLPLPQMMPRIPAAPQMLPDRREPETMPDCPDHGHPMMAAAEPEMMPDPEVQMMPDHQMLPMHQLAELQAMPALETPAPTNEAGWQQEEDQAAWTYEDDGPEPAQAAPYPSEGGYAVAPPTAAGSAVRRAMLWVALASVLFLSATIVHLAVVPLNVLAVWRQPARLQVDSLPAGAEVFIDGRRLSARTPTFTDVVRDTGLHTVEVRLEGYRTEKHGVSYSKSLRLAVSVRLAPSGAPAAETAAPPGTRAGRTPDPAPRNPGF